MAEVTNEQVIEAMKRSKDLRAERIALIAEISALEDQLVSVDRDIAMAGSANTIVDGVAIYVAGATVDCPSNGRHTDEYVNVRTGETGLYLREWSEDGGGYVEYAVATSLPDAEAMAYAIRWVVHGEIPEDDRFIISRHYDG